MRIKKVLIADKMYESIVPLLEEAGVKPFYAPEITRMEILAQIGEYDGLIIRSKTPVDAELIDAGSSLCFVARAGAGVDNVDADHLTERGVELINAPEGNRDAVGEHTLGMLLSILHRINYSYAKVKALDWDREAGRGMELKTQTVGIFGVGNMGNAFGAKLSGFGCEVIGYDTSMEHIRAKNIRPVSLEEFLERTNVLSIHVPLTVQTKGLFDRDFLNRFSNLKILLNTSRGEVLNQKDLLELLDEGKLVGAGLDVLENERPGSFSKEEKARFERLINHPNVLITPHVAGWTFESYERINEVLVEKIKRLQT